MGYSYIYLTKKNKTRYKILIGFIKQISIALLNFSGSLASMTNASNFTTYISSNNQPCMTRPTLINLNLNEFDQGLRCHTVMVN